MTLLNITGAQLLNDSTKQLKNLSTIDDAAEQRSPFGPTLIGITLGLICCTTIFGNVLVLHAVRTTRSLRTATHYLVVNLAIFDLCLGIYGWSSGILITSIFVLPFSASLEVLNNEWIWGGILCEVWCAIDVLCCTGSIMSLCAISIDRYIGVTRPLRHCMIMSERRIVQGCVFIWALSTIASVPPLFGWREQPMQKLVNSTSPNGTITSELITLNDDKVCLVNTNTGYVMFSIIVSFYVPAMIICLLYGLVYAAINRRNKEFSRGRNSVAVVTGTSLMTAAKGVGTDSGSEISLRSKFVSSVSRTLGTVKRGGHLSAASSPSLDPASPLVSKQQQYGASRMNRMQHKQTKAAKTLGIVVGFFFFCWFPWFFVLPLKVLCKSCVVPELVEKFVFWLGYCNSMINWIIYATLSREFSSAFRRIICCESKAEKARRDFNRTIGPVQNSSDGGDDHAGFRRRRVIQRRSLLQRVLSSQTRKGDRRILPTIVQKQSEHSTDNATTSNSPDVRFQLDSAKTDEPSEYTASEIKELDEEFMRGNVTTGGSSSEAKGSSKVSDSPGGKSNHAPTSKREAAVNNSGSPRKALQRRLAERDAELTPSEKPLTESEELDAATHSLLDRATDSANRLQSTLRRIRICDHEIEIPQSAPIYILQQTKRVPMCDASTQSPSWWRKNTRRSDKIIKSSNSILHSRSRSQKLTRNYSPTDANSTTDDSRLDRLSPSLALPHDTGNSLDECTSNVLCGWSEQLLTPDDILLYSDDNSTDSAGSILEAPPVHSKNPGLCTLTETDAAMSSQRECSPSDLTGEGWSTEDSLEAEIPRAFKSRSLKIVSMSSSNRPRYRKNIRNGNLPTGQCGNTPAYIHSKQNCIRPQTTSGDRGREISSGDAPGPFSAPLARKFYERKREVTTWSARRDEGLVSDGSFDQYCSTYGSKISVV